MHDVCDKIKTLNAYLESQTNIHTRDMWITKFKKGRIRSLSHAKEGTENELCDKVLGSIKSTYVDSLGRVREK